MSDTENEIDVAEEVQPVNKLEAQGEQEDAPVSSDAPSATPGEVAAAPPSATAREVPDLREGVTIGTPMAKVDEASRQYTDELVKPQMAKQKVEVSKAFVKIEKAQLSTLVQVYDGNMYTEFALDDVDYIQQASGENFERPDMTSMRVGINGTGVVVGLSKLDAEELLKKWRGVRATQRR